MWIKIDLQIKLYSFQKYVIEGIADKLDSSNILIYLSFAILIILIKFMVA
jgi:hypothetical protein